MANVPGTFYTAETQRRGTTPVSPPSAVDDPQDPVNPSGPPVVPPVAERYASEAAMIADQLNQKSGYLYFDGTDTWWYLGTTTGAIADYEAFGGGGGGGGGHVIKADGTPLAQRAGLNFSNQFTVSDDAGNDETDVEIDENIMASRAYVDGGSNVFNAASRLYLFNNY